MHVDYAPEQDDIKSQSIISKVPKAQIDTLECTLEEKGYIRRVNGKRYGKWEVLI